MFFQKPAIVAGSFNGTIRHLNHRGLDDAVRRHVNAEERRELEEQKNGYARQSKQKQLIIRLIIIEVDAIATNNLDYDVISLDSGKSKHPQRTESIAKGGWWVCEWVGEHAVGWCRV